MAPLSAAQTLLSPAELSYIHASLSQNPPIRLDARSLHQFRPLVAECDFLPTTNGSARVCFSDGTEAIVGVKAEVEKTRASVISHSQDSTLDEDASSSDEEADTSRSREPMNTQKGKGNASWLEISVEIPGFRDDDSLPVFLAAMLSEALLASRTLADKLYLNDRWHWRLYIDILLLSPPLSYPLPLLSLTTHLALLNTKLPRRTSEPADDPIFDDDWASALPLYPRSAAFIPELPPVTLLVMTVGNNIIFDPSREELAVAEGVMAVSIAQTVWKQGERPSRQVLAVRIIDPPARLTPLGVPNSANPATGAVQPSQARSDLVTAPLTDAEKANVWTPPRGGMKRGLVSRIIQAVLEDKGAGEEVLAGLAGVET